ncbi:hypothetical protein QQ045_014949 [Rhodiola kirilowii]
MHVSLNSTYVALVPKNKNPNSPKDYRPISCCSVVYKIIALVLANRLKSVLPNLIGPSQSAYVHCRSIVHIICLAQELLSQYNRKNISKRCILKIDICKDYDTVDWDFLRDIMSSMGFPTFFY